MYQNSLGVIAEEGTSGRCACRFASVQSATGGKTRDRLAETFGRSPPSGPDPRLCPPVWLELRRARRTDPAIVSSQGTSSSRGNRIIDRLPDAEREWLVANATRESLPARRVLFEPGTLVTTVHFPLAGMVSLVATMRDGSAVETAAVGREGVVGLPMAVSGRSTESARAIVQVEGSSLALSTATFQAAMARNGALAHLVQDFIHSLFALTAQNVACNRLHTIQQRLARWLLLTRDRTEDDSFSLTQEFMAEMLGTRRPSVTEAVRSLERAQAIRRSRGRVDIVDEGRLESLACECYEVIRASFERDGSARHG